MVSQRLRSSICESTFCIQKSLQLPGGKTVARWIVVSKLGDLGEKDTAIFKEFSATGLTAAHHARLD